jgi:metal-responsive CopG/Arc/MetJ family transcriptional regulator
MSRKVKMTISLPEDLANSLRENIPDRYRSKFITKSIEKNLNEIQKNNLIRAYQSAYQEIAEESKEYDGVTGDGIS